MKKRISAFVLSLAVSQGLLPINVFADNTVYDDISNHYAQKQIEKWSELGVVQGYNGNYRPYDNVTRGEFAVIIDRVMQYTTKSSSIFLDLDENFYTDALLKANNSNIITGYNGNIRPNDKITREEASVILCRALGLTSDNSITNFNDNSQISSWAKNSVATLSALGYINGDTNNYFNPQNNLSRGDLVIMLNNCITKIHAENSVFTDDIDGNVVINTTNADVKNSTISQNLIISEGVDDGDISIESSKILGDTYIRGGGSNSIFWDNSSSPSTIFIEKTDVSLKINDFSSIATIKVQNSADIVIDETSIVDTIETYASLNLQGNGNITTLVVNSDEITLNEDIKIENLIINQNVLIKGVTDLNLVAQNIEMQSNVIEFEILEDDTNNENSSSSSSGGSSSSGSSSGGSSNDNNTGGTDDNNTGGTDDNNTGDTDDNNTGDTDDNNTGGTGDNNTGDTGDNNTGGTGDNNTGGTDDNNQDDNEQVVTNIIKEQDFYVYNVENIDFAVLQIQKGNMDDYTFKISGKNIVPTPVNDEKTIVKFAVNPKEALAVTVSDGTNAQEIVLSSGSETFDGLINVPVSILTSGPVDYFDYYLPPYDSNGQVRVNPLKSTFATTETPTVEGDIVLWTPNKNSASENVIIKYNNSDIATDWEQNITGIYRDFGTSESMRVEIAYKLGNNSVYDGQVVRQIELDTTSANSYFNGRNTEHTIIIKSTGYDDMWLTFETVIDNTGMSLYSNHEYIAENPLMFQFNDYISFPYNEVQNVYLDGELLEGDCVDYHVVADYLTIGCMTDSTVFEKLTIGDHTLKVEVMGIDTYIHEFSLRQAYAGEKNELAYDETDSTSYIFYTDNYKITTDTNVVEPTVKYSSNLEYDVMTTATSSGSTGDSSDGSSGTSIRADVIWEFDLILNAKILRFTENETVMSENIIEWWESLSIDAVIPRDGQDILVDYQYYKNKVGFKNGDDTYYTFDEYYADLILAELSKPSTFPYTTVDGVYMNRPYYVKNMLETAELGDEYLFSEINSAYAPTLSVNSYNVSAGDSIVITYSGGSNISDWVNNIDYITNYENSYLRYTYTLDKANNTITIVVGDGEIGGNYIPLGSSTIAIYSTGYAPATVKINKAESFDTTNISSMIDDDGNVVISGVDEDFIKNLTGVSSNLKNTLFTDSAVGSNSGDYNIVNGNFVIKEKLFTNYKDEQTTITFSSYGYEDVQVKFTYNSLDYQNPKNEVPSSVELQSTSAENGEDVTIIVGNTTYLDAITLVLVGSTSADYTIDGGNIVIDASCLTVGVQNITIKADGYYDKEFSLTVGDETDKAVPYEVGFRSGTLDNYTYSNSKEVEATSDQSVTVYFDDETYKSAVTSISIVRGNGINSTIDISDLTTYGLSQVSILRDNFATGTNTLTISAKGYVDKVITVIVEEISDIPFELSTSNTYAKGSNVYFDYTGDAYLSPYADYYSISVNSNTGLSFANGNSSPYYVSSDNFQEAGEYKITLSRENYTDKVFTITIEESSTSVVVPNNIGLNTSSSSPLSYSNSLTLSGNSNAYLYFDDASYRSSITSITLLDSENTNTNIDTSSIAGFMGNYKITLYPTGWSQTPAFTVGTNTVTVKSAGYQDAIFTIICS